MNGLPEAKLDFERLNGFNGSQNSAIPFFHTIFSVCIEVKLQFCIVSVKSTLQPVPVLPWRAEEEHFRVFILSLLSA